MKNAASITAELLTVFETVPDLYLILSPDLTILTASNAYLRSTFQVRENIQGKNLFDVFPDNLSNPGSSTTMYLRSSLEKVVKEKTTHQMGLQRYDVPLENATKGFKEKYWIPSNTPVLGEDGEILYIIHKVTDVTQQVQEGINFTTQRNLSDAKLKVYKENEILAKAEIEMQRDLLQALLNQAPVAMCLFQGEDQIIGTVNPLMAQIWDRTRDQVIGKPILEALPELKGQGFDQIIKQVATTGEPVVGKESPASMFRNGQLETNYYNFVFQPLYNQQGTLLGVFEVAVEVTDLVTARKKVEESERQLRELNAELASANNAIAASNEELRTANEELLETHSALHNLNLELEKRIKIRTEEVEQAQALAEIQSKRLENLFMQAPAAICILEGPDLVYGLVNPGYQQLFPDREILGKPILEALPEVKDNEVYTSICSVYEMGISQEEPELLIPFVRLSDGQLEDRYFRYVLQPRYTEQGQVDGVVVFAIEVTEQVEARKAVEKSVTQLRLITDSLPVLIGYLDKEEKYQFTNKAYEAWFNTKPENLLGRPVRDVVGDAAYFGVKKYIDRALAGERLDFESRMPYREDFVKFIKTSYVPDIRNGEVKGFYTLVTDVTEQVEARNAVEQSGLQARAMAEELRVANEQLTRTNIDLDNFIYTASHDLKAPISNIEGLINILTDSLSQETKASEEVNEIMQMIDESIKRFKRTIDHLTEVVKLQKENSHEPVLVNLAEVINEVRLDLAPQLEAARAEIVIDVETCSGINFSQKNLRSIVYNLISNAAKYASPERTPVIEIKCHTEDDYVMLAVKDNGLGMDLRGSAKLFTMFGRLHDHVEGTGIGLYMVKKIIENAGGRIEVESKIGTGTTFKVYFKI